jgi:hypothetical protein
MLLRASLRLAFAAVAVILAGCSGVGNPSSPAIENDLTAPATADSSGLHTQSHACWGFYDVAVDTNAGTIEAIPIRGAMFNANVTRFLQPPSSPIHLLSITVNPDTDFQMGYVDIDVTIRHPFVGLNMFRGFDVRGIVMGEGDFPFDYDPTALRSGPSELQLLNADGYSRWWNPVEFTSYGKIFGYTQGAKATPTYLATATVSAYKYFADDLAADTPLSDLNPEFRGTFSVSPGMNTRQYVLQFPVLPGGGPVYHFNYAVDASWALPDNQYAPAYPLEAFPPDANGAEAWLVKLDSGDSTAWYVNSTANGGELVLSVEVFDWQGALQPSGVADEVANIWVESPILDSPTEIASLATPAPGGLYSSVWTAELSNLQLTSAGDFDCWVAVEASNPENYAPQYDGDPSLFDWPDKPLSAYSRHTVAVLGTSPSNAPEVIEIIPPQGEVSTVLTDVQVVGNWFQNGAVVEFVNDASFSLTLSNVAWIDEHLIMCDVDCFAPLGFYHVIVVNPDTQQGTLINGFEIVEAWKCEGSAHDFDNEYDINGVTYDSAFYRFDMAILYQGSQAGMALYQMDNNDWGVVDPTAGAGQTIQHFMTTSFNSYTVDIETCETTGRIAIVDLLSDEKVHLLDAEGNELGAYQDSTLADGNLTAVDFDKDGDMWAVTRRNDPWLFELRHYALLPDSPFYELVPEDTVDLSGWMADQTGIGDMGISFYLDRLYIITANTIDGGSNRITGWDLSVSPPELVAEHHNPYPPLTRHHIFSQGALSRMNVDVDHRFPTDKEEQCRVYAYATIWTYGPPSPGLLAYVIRMDGDLNILDEGAQTHYPWAATADDLPQCAIINDAGPGAEANLFGCGWRGSDFCAWPVPSDW